MSDLIDSRTVTARKEHRCEECRRIIRPGEQYERQTSIGDDGWQTWKACLPCFAFGCDLYAAGIRGEDPESGAECLPNMLYDVDWREVRGWSPLWAERIDLYQRQWAGQPYPTGEATT